MYAGVPDGPKTFVAKRTVTTTAPSGAVTSAVSIITCTDNIQNAHNSTHVPGTVNVVGTVACDSGVYELALYMRLHRNTVIVGTGSNVRVGAANVQANASAPCSSGWYQERRVP